MKKSVGRFCLTLAVMKAGRACLLAFGLLMVAWPSFSQTTGSIEGRVLDGESRPLTGALVTIRSPSLQGTRTATTDRNGRFLIQGLPPGDYVARAEFTSLPPVDQTGVPVAVDSSRILEFRILPRFREEIEVAGAPPILDATSAATSTVLERKVFKELPTARTFLELAYLAPGVVDSGRNRYPSINGASLAENRYIVDGLDVTDPITGALASTLPVDFLEEVDIKTGGLGPEYGGALGGIVNVVTRTGSNELHGSVFGYYKDDGLKSEPPANVRNERLLSTNEYEAGLTLGGRIVRDRLWYFVGVDPTYRSQEWTTQQAFRVTNDSDTVYYTAKLSGQPHPSHQLVASVFGDPNTATTHALDAAGILRDTTKTRERHFSLAYNGFPSSQLLLEAQVGRYDQTNTIEPAGDGPLYIDATEDVRFARAENCGNPVLLTPEVFFSPGCLGGTAQEDDFVASRTEARAAATLQWKTGRIDHEIKVGGGWRRSTYKTTFHFPAPVAGPFRDRNGNVLNPAGLAGQTWSLGPDNVLLIDLDLDSDSESEEFALFLQDRIRMGERLTVDLGLRADDFESTGERTAADPDLRIKFGFGDTIAPRLGVAWDPFGKGQSRVFARYGRVHESVPLALNSFAFAYDNSFFYFFDYPEDGSLPTVSNLGELIAAFPAGGSAEHVADDLEPMSQDEYAIGVEYQVGSDISVGLTGMYREVIETVDDLCILSCVIANPGGIYRVDPGTGVALPAPVVVPEPVREYRALQLSFQKRLVNHWQLFGSYVYSKLEGTYGGAIHENLAFLNPNLTEAYDDPAKTQNQFGLLPNDRTHQVKLYGSYEWSFGLMSGLVAQYYSGTPVTKRGSYIGSRRTGERLITRRSSSGRTPDIYTIDLHLAYTLPIGKVVTLSMLADVFNLTDAQRAVTVDENWTFARAERTVDPNECGGAGTGPGTACPSGNPNWRGPLSFQDPRTIRLGARLSW